MSAFDLRYDSTMRTRAQREDAEDLRRRNHEADAQAAIEAGLAEALTEGDVADFAVLAEMPRAKEMPRLERLAIERIRRQRNGGGIEESQR